MSEIVVNTQSEAWVAALALLENAPVAKPRGMKVREWPDQVAIRVARPASGFVGVAQGRALRHAVTAVEGLSLVGQTSVPELVTDRVGAFAKYADDGLFWGAYGPRAAGHVGQVVELLTRDPDSRQAVLTFYSADKDLGRRVNDVPCTLSIQFLSRSRGFSILKDGVEREARTLHMRVAMRSNDAWLGLPYDLGQFSLLQMAMAQALEQEVGTYTHTAGSLHLYDEHWDKAKAVRGPATVAVGSRFGPLSLGSYSLTMAEIASRCRRILMGQEVPSPTDLETWLAEQLR